MNKHRSKLIIRFVLIAALASLCIAKWRQSRDLASTASAIAIPCEDLRSLQDQVQSVIAQVMPCVVAIETAESGLISRPLANPTVTRRSASGVIISADGLVLSQFHVTHRLVIGPEGEGRCRQPGEIAMVALSDGRKIGAKLLGADQSFDLSLLQLMEPGPYPYRPLDAIADVALGDWALKLGHPTGYRADRPTVARLGRVLYRNDDVFVTDCLMVGGDSGGPFFDVQGRLVGIIHNDDAPGSLHGLMRNHNPKSRSIGPWSSTTSKFIREFIPAMKQGIIVPFNQTGYERFVAGFHQGDTEDTLPKEQWTQGQVDTVNLRQAVKYARRSVVSIIDEADRDAALGTIVGEDGWIVTVASTLPANPRCRLPGGRIVSGQLIGIDPAYDLALIRVNASSLDSIRWNTGPRPAAGTILAAAGLSEAPAAIGIVSVMQRGVPGPFATQISRAKARPIPVSGRSTAEGFVADGVGEEALESGIQPGDLIQSLAGKEIRSERDMIDASEGHFDGERVPVRCSRAGQMRDLTLEFTAEAKSHPDIPIFFECDLPLPETRCGGPVVDLDGNVLGMIIFRHEYGCIVLPSERVIRLWPSLRYGNITDRWVKPPTANPTSAR